MMLMKVFVGVRLRTRPTRVSLFIAWQILHRLYLLLVSCMLLLMLNVQSYYPVVKHHLKGLCVNTCVCCLRNHIISWVSRIHIFVMSIILTASTALLLQLLLLQQRPFFLFFLHNNQFLLLLFSISYPRIPILLPHKIIAMHQWRCTRIDPRILK